MITPLVALIGAACAYTSGHTAKHSELHDDQDNHHWHLVWVTPDCKVDWTADGEVWYRDDGKDVARLSPGAMLTVVEQDVLHFDFAAAARSALARMNPRQADALILRYGLDDHSGRSFRQIGRHLGVFDHTARTLVERAQTELRRLIT